MDTLAAIYRSSFSRKLTAFAHSWSLKHYDEAALSTEVDLMAQWYLPYAGQALSIDKKQQWDGLWNAAFTALNAHTPGLTLRDFHAENIFWLPQRKSTDRIGLIDFQDALFGHPAYDVVSLIEDARRDVDPKLTEDLLARFCERTSLKLDDAFRAAYAVIGAQRNAKILGIFVRLAQRDGKQGYLEMLPRVKAHFIGNLAHPVMKDLRAFLKEIL